MPPKFTQTPDMSAWSQCIGGLVINFGIAEFYTLRCVEVLSGATSAIAIRKKKLFERINEAKRSIEASQLPPEKKTQALALWTEVGTLASVRNRVAHNPLVRGFHPATKRYVFSVIDLQKMVPVGDNILEPLDYVEIERVALRIRDITRELGEIIETNQGPNPPPEPTAASGGCSP